MLNPMALVVESIKTLVVAARIRRSEVTIRSEVDYVSIEP